MYEPEINDYVQWTTELGQVHQGWVYLRQNQQHPKEAGSHPRGISQSKWV